MAKYYQSPCNQLTVFLLVRVLLMFDFVVFNRKLASALASEMGFSPGKANGIEVIIYDEVL